MQINASIKENVDKVYDGLSLTRQNIVSLLDISPHSVDAGLIIGVADEINRIASKGKAEVHAQIGLNLSPCPNNCSFCAFSAENRVFTERKELGVEEIVHLAFKAEGDGANAIFFMTTHDYPLGKYIETSKEVRKKLKPETVWSISESDNRGETKGFPSNPQNLRFVIGAYESREAHSHKRPHTGAENRFLACRIEGVRLPCLAGGNKRFAMSQADEMIFAAPYAKIEELLTALRKLDEYGLLLTLGYLMVPEYRLRDPYLKMGRMMGTEMDEGKKATVKKW